MSKRTDETTFAKVCAEVRRRAAGLWPPMSVRLRAGRKLSVGQSRCYWGNMSIELFASMWRIFGSCSTRCMAAGKRMTSSSRR